MEEGEGGNFAQAIPTSNPDPDQEQGDLGTRIKEVLRRPRF